MEEGMKPLGAPGDLIGREGGGPEQLLGLRMIENPCHDVSPSGLPFRIGRITPIAKTTSITVELREMTLRKALQRNSGCPT